MYKIIGADGREYGPVTTEQLRQWIAEGRVNAKTPVQRPSETSWQPLAQVPELASLVSGSTAPPLARPLSAAPVPHSVPNYLVPAILVTLCCCLPFGIPALVFAAQVNGKVAAGDWVGAQLYSRKARFWCWMSFLAGGGIMLVWFLVAFVSTFLESL